MPYTKPSEKRIELEDEFIMPPAILFDERVDEAYESFINTCGCDKGKAEFYEQIFEKLSEEKDLKIKIKGDPEDVKDVLDVKEAEDTARYTDPISGKDYSSGSELESALDREKQTISTSGKENKDLHSIISVLSDMSISTEDLSDKNDLYGDKSEKDDQEGDRQDKDVKEVEDNYFVEYGKIKVSCEACNNYTTLPDQESALSYAKEHQMKLGYAHVCTFE